MKFHHKWHSPDGVTLEPISPDIEAEDYDDGIY
jgi:hypothetical protein